MKPTKNRVFCNDCKRLKMLFETEKKANTFIKFNSEEIEDETGIRPGRSYFCILCNGWHVTSKEDNAHFMSRNTAILEKIEYEKQKKAEISKRNAEREKIREEQFMFVEKCLTTIETNLEVDSLEGNIKLLDDAIKGMEIINDYIESKNRKKKLRQKIALLKDKISFNEN